MAFASIQDEAVVKDLNRRGKQLSRQIKALREQMERFLTDFDDNKSRRDDTLANTDPLYTGNNAVSWQDLNNLARASEDIYAYMTNGNDISGASHTRNSSDDAQLFTWLGNIYDRNLDE